MWDRLEQREIARRGLRPGPGDRPRPDLPVGTDLLPKIKHIVVLTMLLLLPWCRLRYQPPVSSTAVTPVTVRVWWSMLPLASALKSMSM